MTRYTTTMLTISSRDPLGLWFIILGAVAILWSYGLYA